MSAFLKPTPIGPDPRSDGATKTADIETARNTVKRCIEAAPHDPTTHLTRDAMDAFSAIRKFDPIEYEAVRTRLRAANHLIRVEALDRFTCPEGDDAGVDQRSASTELAELAAERCELWHDPDGDAYATFERGAEGQTHREHWRIESSGYRDWLAWLAHVSMGATPSSEALRAASNALAGRAKFDGEEHSPARRVARTDEGYWLDLGDEHWRAVLMTAAGWRIVGNPPVRFVRSRAMRPLPTPAEKGDIAPLWGLTNILKTDRPLVLAWILEAYRSDTPYPVLELIGEQGSAKSTTQETIRHFVDPNRVMLRGRPKAVEDIFVACGANHVVSLENLSSITPDLSDALCTISTGGGHAGRQFYTNGEEHIIPAHNPIMLNGIGAVVTRPDLLDRTIALSLPTIERRDTESEHAARLERDGATIMAGLLNLYCETLAQLPDVQIDPEKRPRMADYAMLGEAMHRAMGGVTGGWLNVYSKHRRDAIRRTIDSSPVAQACIEFTEANRVYAGTVKGLLEALNHRDAGRSVERGDYWPRSPKGLGDALRRAAPALRQIGVYLCIEDRPRRDGVHCKLRTADPKPRPATPPNREPSSQSSHVHEREVVRI